MGFVYEVSCTVGDWKGVQTGYDPNENSVADHMYFDTNLKPMSNGNEVKHTNSIVMSEIRTDCEVCFDSEKIKTKDVGIYVHKNKFKIKIL